MRCLNPSLTILTHDFNHPTKSDLPLPLPHTEPNFWWEVGRDEGGGADGEFYYYPNTQNIRCVRECVCVCVCS